MMNFKKNLIIGVLITVLSSCKKDDILPIEIDEVVLDTTKVGNKSDLKTYNVSEYLDNLKVRKVENIKSKSKRVKRVNKFRYFIKSKLKKSK